MIRVLEIRRYTDADHDDVWNLHILGLQQVGAYLGNGPWDDDLHNIECVYLNNRGEFLVGVYEGRLIAMGALRKITDELAEIKRIRVLENRLFYAILCLLKKMPLFFNNEHGYLRNLY